MTLKIIFSFLVIVYYETFFHILGYLNAKYINSEKNKKRCEALLRISQNDYSQALEKKLTTFKSSFLSFIFRIIIILLAINYEILGKLEVFSLSLVSKFNLVPEIQGFLFLGFVVILLFVWCEIEYFWNTVIKKKSTAVVYFLD